MNSTLETLKIGRMTLAIYRKYRPKKLSDVLGQETITEILKNASSAGRLAHAYLFYGPRGSGKTTTARIVAKIANCEKREKDESFRKLGEPCNECHPCKEIDAGQALDVVEIDAASNRGIDEIRDLKEGIKFSPTSYKYKVFIIDEAHQLTKEAFNALLKTLEEPPAHAIFILATTESERMPLTITSRTQRFQFKRLPLLTIIKKIKAIVKQENIQADDNALELIAAAAEGSFRDAESLLDQIASLKDKIGLNDVQQILGRIGFSKIADLAEIVIKKDLQAALDYLNHIYGEGYNIVQFNKDLINYFRRVLALRFGPQLSTAFAREMTDSELQSVKKHAAAINPESTISLLKSLMRAYTEMRYSPFPLVPLEVAIIENLKSAS